MIQLKSELKDVNSVAIAGHIRPDGDCVGSCMGMYLYIKEQFPQIDVTVYLEEFPESFRFIKGTDEVCHSCEEDRVYDLFIALDSGDTKRLGAAVKYLETAKRSICVDHHISNKGYADENYIVPAASSTSELVFGLIDAEKITKETAEALYMGIVHDTGVFQYSCTSAETMRIAGILMEKGIDYSRIVEETFFQKTYVQNQILGRALLESILMLNGSCIISVVRKREMEFYGVSPIDLEGIVSQLRNTKGAHVAIFMYETNNQEYKVSLRSSEKVNVSDIAVYFGGGGHVRAAGCTMQGSEHDVINNLVKHIEKQIAGSGELQGV